MLFLFTFIFRGLNLVMMACLKLLVMMGGGGGCEGPPFFYLCKQKNRETEKIMNYVDIFLSGSFEDNAIFHVILEIDT